MTSAESPARGERWQLESYVRLVDTGDGAVLLDTRRGTYWQLNASAATIFEAVREAQPLDGIVKTITATFEGERDPADDVRALLHSALEAGLVRHA